MLKRGMKVQLISTKEIEARRHENARKGYPNLPYKIKIGRVGTIIAEEAPDGLAICQFWNYPPICINRQMVRPYVL